MLALAAAFALPAAEAAAQTPAPCANPAADNAPTVPTGPVSCNRSSAGDIEINAKNVAISTTGSRANGIYGRHRQDGDIAVDVTGGEITTTGFRANGIYTTHEFGGDTGIAVRDVAIEVRGERAYGIYDWHRRNGAVAIDARDVTVKALGSQGRGIQGLHYASGNVDIRTENAAIETRSGDYAAGIVGWKRGAGRVDIRVRSGSITTRSRAAYGILGYHQSGGGDVHIDVQGGVIDTEGNDAYPVYGLHRNTGRIDIRVTGARIETAGRQTYGVLGNHESAGDIGIVVRDTRISTTGDVAGGVYGFQQGTTGTVAIDVEGGSITTMGASAHGIRAANVSGGSIAIVLEGGSVRAAGANASGIHVGRLNADTGAVEHAASDADGDGYRDQTVRVNGAVRGGSGDAAGVWLAGGGRVIVGPQGSVGAESGIAILGAGSIPAAGSAGTAVRQTGGGDGLFVSLDLAGRPLRQAIDGAVRNDAGALILEVDGVRLLDGAAGPTGRLAPNGARDVQIRAGPEPALVDPYAPRAAVYEALPGFLLRLDEHAGGRRAFASGTPLWLRLGRGGGAYDPERASVGANYDFGSTGIEAGVDVALGEALAGSFAAHVLKGSADVASPAGGGEDRGGRPRPVPRRLVAGRRLVCGRPGRAHPLGRRPVVRQAGRTGVGGRGVRPCAQFGGGPALRLRRRECPDAAGAARPCRIVARRLRRRGECARLAG